MTSILSSGIVEVAIGLAFVYLLLSLLCSVVNEWIAGILGSRAYNLEKGINSLFTDGKLRNNISIAAAIYDHGLIQSLYTASHWDKFLSLFRRKPGPSYIAPQLFASTWLISCSLRRMLRRVPRRILPPTRKWKLRPSGRQPWSHLFARGLPIFLTAKASKLSWPWLIRVRPT